MTLTRILSPLTGRPLLTLVRRTWPAVLFVAVLGVSPVFGQDGPKDDESIWTQPTLITRPWLSEYGISFGGNVTQYAFGLVGGIDNPAVPAPFGQGDVAKYTGRGEYDLKVDLEKVVGLSRGRLLVRAEHWFGQFGNVSLNTGAFTPAVFAALLPPVPESEWQLFLTNFLYTQPLHKYFVVFAGKKDVLLSDPDKFASGDGTDQFVNQALIANSAILAAFPYSSFTAGVLVPLDDLRTVAYVFDPENRTETILPNNLFSKGVIVGGEVRLRVDPGNLPGHQSVGGIWKHVDLPDLSRSGPRPSPFLPELFSGVEIIADSWTIYYNFDQYLQLYSQKRNHGWGLFGRASLSDGNPTPIRWFLSLGIGGDSPFRNRERDTFGAGWFYVGTTDQFGPGPTAQLGPRDGFGLELFYNFEIIPWLHVTPDVQLIRPGGGALATDLAFVGGFRVKVTL